MAKDKQRILILEDDACFRELLQNACHPLAETLSTGEVETALGFLSSQPFDLLLLDWHLLQTVPSFHSLVETYQSRAQKIALFTVPDLANVIAAMKGGASDILWAAQDKDVIRENIHKTLNRPPAEAYPHSYIARLAESLTEKALSQNTSLFRARREFSRTFLQQVLSHQKLRKTQLANLMQVSPRTLHRHLST